MIDYAKRDAKINQKLEEIRNAQPEQVERVLIKALKALFNVGVEQSRKELEWCQYCEGRGYVEHDGLSFGAYGAPPRTLKKRFCGCARGQELKSVAGGLGNWSLNIPI